MLEALKTRILNMVARAIIDVAKTEDQGTSLKVDLLADETRDEIELFQQYGFNSIPQKGAEAIALFLAGARDNGVVISTRDSRFTIKEMKPGEVAIFTDEGDKIHLKRNRLIEIETETLNIKASKEVNIDTPQVGCSGEVSDSTGNLSSLRNNYNSHVHIGNLGAPTSTPDKPDSGGS